MKKIVIYDSYFGNTQTIAETIVLEPNEDGLVNPQKLEEALEKFKDRKFKCIPSIITVIFKYFTCAI